MQRPRHARKARGLDFYQTPRVAVAALLRAERLPHGLWEPHCGLGGISEPLLDAGHAVYASDIIDRGYAYQCGVGSFLDARSCPAGVEGIVMNPPFFAAAEHIRHAITICPQVYALLRLSFLEAGNGNTVAGRARLFCLDSGVLARVHIFIERLPMMHREGWEGRRSTSTIPYAWYVFDGDHQGPASLSRISWRGLT